MKYQLVLFPCTPPSLQCVAGQSPIHSYQLAMGHVRPLSLQSWGQMSKSQMHKLMFPKLDKLFCYNKDYSMGKRLEECRRNDGR